jgi:ribosomal protein L29
MVKLKSADVRKMSASERGKKLDELKLELVKSKGNAAKTGSSKSRDIRKMIARIYTINTQDEKKGKNNEEKKEIKENTKKINKASKEVIKKR